MPEAYFQLAVSLSGFKILIHTYEPVVQTSIRYCGGKRIT